MKKWNQNIFYIRKKQIPTSIKVTYANEVCNYRPLKDDTYRVRLTVGWDKLPYPNDAGSPAANITEYKLMINNILSTTGEKIITINIKEYFLWIPMDSYEHMKIKYDWILDEISYQYKLNKLVGNDGYIYC